MFIIDENSINLLTIILIGIGLSMDAFAVGISCGLIKNEIKIKFSLKISSFFGVFQFGMVFLGFLTGKSFINKIKDYDHWLAFLILFLIGLKMIYESFKNTDERKINPEDLKTLFIFSIATSIDAFAIGISLSLLKISILVPSIIIGLITFILSLISVYLGCVFGKIIRKGTEIIGGLILISVGIKILLEHII